MIKQVIVIRKDLKMRRGKECAQVAHASMMFMTERFILSDRSGCYPSRTHEAVARFSDEEWAWIEGKFTKVVLQVDSEGALCALEAEAKDAGLEAYLVVDSGATEFGGVPTPTCLAIGPDDAEKIDAVTKELKLY